MTPEERLERIVEQQRELRQRLAELNTEITELRFALSENKQAPEPAASASAAPPPESPAQGVEVPSAPVKAAVMPPPLPAVLAASQRNRGATVAEVAPVDASAAPVPQVTPAPAAAAAAVIPTPPRNDGPAAPVTAKSGDLEMQLGKVWFVRIGVAAMLTGLALGSVYAYQNFVREMPAILKVLALYLLSGGLTGLGMWLERSRESLLTYGRVITAGGFAAIFYTTHAMHYVEPLRVVQSPVLAGVFLLACALGIFWYADRRKDQTVAALAMVFGYYGTSINAVGWFSLFSNLVLTAGGLWLLWRHRWIALGLLSLAGCYGGFAFWQYALPLLTTGSLAPMNYWAGQGFLISCWVLFSAVFVFAPADTVKMALRTTLAAANNGAFFALFCIALLANVAADQRQDAFAAFALLWGAILFVLCWAAEKTHGPGGRPLGELLFACGLVEISLGLAIKLSGYQLATVFAFKTVVLAWLGQRQNRIVAEVGAALLAGLVVLSPDGWGASSMSHRPWLEATASPGEQAAVWLQAGLLVLAGWLARGGKAATAKPHNKADGQSLWFCLAGMMTWTLKWALPFDAATDLMWLFGFCAAWLVIGGRGVLNFPEMRHAGSIGALFGSLVLFNATVLSSGGLLAGPDFVDVEPIFDVPRLPLTPISISVLAVMLCALAWLCKRDHDTAGEERFAVDGFVFGLAALAGWASVVLLPLDAPWKSTCLLLACGAVYGLAGWRRLRLAEFFPVARIGALTAALAIVWSALSQRSSGVTLAELATASLNVLLLGAAAWLAKHRREKWMPAAEAGLAPFPVLYAGAALAQFIFTVFLPVAGAWQPAGWVLFCAVLMAAGKMTRLNLPELSVAAGFAALLMSLHELSAMHGPETRGAELWLLLSFFGLAVAAVLPATGWALTSEKAWLPRLRWLAAAQTTLAYLHWWAWHEPDFFPLATAAMGLLLAGVARWKSAAVAAGLALLMMALALLTLFANIVDPWLSPLPPGKPHGWSVFVPLLVMAAEWLLRGSACFKEKTRRAWCHGTAVGAVLVLWTYLTFHVLASGAYRTMAWAGLALGLFLLGLALGHAVYRRCGLLVLTLALGRIVFYDVWQLGTAARFASFLVIGAVLVALGFFYNRFEDFIRRYL